MVGGDLLLSFFILVSLVEVVCGGCTCITGLGQHLLPPEDIKVVGSEDPHLAAKIEEKLSQPPPTTHHPLPTTHHPPPTLDSSGQLEDQAKGALGFFGEYEPPELEGSMILKHCAITTASKTGGVQEAILKEIEKMSKDGSFQSWRDATVGRQAGFLFVEAKHYAVAYVDMSKYPTQVRSIGAVVKGHRNYAVSIVLYVGARLQSAAENTHSTTGGSADGTGADGGQAGGEDGGD